MKHYVYIARLDGEVVYIGKGTGERYTHVTSGTSHCYLANKAHFEGKNVTVEVTEHFETSEEALAREAELIEHYKPVWNYQHRPANLRKRRGKGVQYIEGRSKPWRAYIHINNKKVFIGNYLTESEAIEARRTYL